MTERRKHKRWLLSTFFDTYNDETDTSVGYLAEISHGGVMLINEQPIQTNIVMPLKITFEDRSDEDNQMQVVSKVVRCEKNRNLDYYNTGCKLVDLSTDDKKVIERIIKMYAMEQKI